MPRTKAPRGNIPLRPTERQLQDAIEEAAQILGYKTYHTWVSLHSSGGFPDLVMLKAPMRGERGRLIFAEIKGPRGRVSGEQAAWLADLQLTGVEAYLWYPEDWFNGRVWAVLRGDVP